MPGNRQMARTPPDGSADQIDRLVYELYRLTEDEIHVIEEVTACP